MTLDPDPGCWMNVSVPRCLKPRTGSAPVAPKWRCCPFHNPAAYPPAASFLVLRCSCFCSARQLAGIARFPPRGGRPIILHLASRTYNHRVSETTSGTPFFDAARAQTGTGTLGSKHSSGL